jgi:hypothetical protein
VAAVTVVNSSAGPAPEGWIVAAGDPLLAAAPTAFVPLADRVGRGKPTPLMLKAT